MQVTPVTLPHLVPHAVAVTIAVPQLLSLPHSALNPNGFDLSILWLRQLWLRYVMHDCIMENNEFDVCLPKDYFCVHVFFCENDPKS
jgi:hypothetical protein